MIATGVITSRRSLLLAASLFTTQGALAATLPESLDTGLGSVEDRTFTTQAGRDWFEQQRRTAAERQAEHLLARLHEASDAEAATLSDPELAQIAETLNDPRVIDLLETSAYYMSVLEGRQPQLD